MASPVGYNILRLHIYTTAAEARDTGNWDTIVGTGHGIGDRQEQMYTGPDRDTILQSHSHDEQLLG